MKNATKFCIITIVIGMLLAFTIFTLFANGMLTLDTSSPFLNILILFAGAMLVALLTGSLAAKNEPRLRQSRCHRRRMSDPCRISHILKPGFQRNSVCSGHCRLFFLSCTAFGRNPVFSSCLFFFPSRFLRQHFRPGTDLYTSGV